MSILRQLNDEIIEKLKVSWYPPSPDQGTSINVDQEFTITFVVTNDSNRYPGMKFSNVALEVLAIPPCAEVVDGDTLLSKRVPLGTVDWNDRKEVSVKFKAKADFPFPDFDRYGEQVATWKIAADVSLRCKDLSNPKLRAQIHPRD